MYSKKCQMLIILVLLYVNVIHLLFFFSLVIKLTCNVPECHFWFYLLYFQYTRLLEWEGHTVKHAQLWLCSNILRARRRIFWSSIMRINGFKNVKREQYRTAEKEWACMWALCHNWQAKSSSSYLKVFENAISNWITD